MASFIPGRDTMILGSAVDGMFCAGQEVEMLFGKGTQIFPNLPVPIWSTTMCRVVEESGKRWFEFGFRIDTQLTGHPATGWLDAGNYIRLEPQWSPDLVNWHAGKFMPAPVPVLEVEPGMWEYWSRALNPAASAVRTGQIRAESGTTMGISGDPRNNPFVSVVLAGVAQALPNYPYTMPTDAAQLQTDLIEAGWAGTVVEADDDTHWSVTVPNVDFTELYQDSRIYWPAYLVPDIYGNLVNISDSNYFSGSYVDESGVAIHDKAFARLKLSAGPRYDPYL